MIPLDRILASGALLLSLQVAQATEGQNVFTQGGQNPAAMACMGCHGADGMGMAAAGFPRLAGLPAGYLSKQLADFRSGSRKNPIMEPLAKALSASEIQAVSAALAAMPTPKTPLVRRQQMASSPDEKLALYGDWARSIPGCVQCHGPRRGRRRAFSATGASAGHLSGGTAQRVARRHSQQRFQPAHGWRSQGIE